MLHHFQSLRGLNSLFRKNLLTGIFVLIPFGVVAWILVKVFSGLWQFHKLLPAEWQPNLHFTPVTAQILNFLLTVGLTFIFAVLVSLLGWASKQYVGGKVLSLLSYIIQRIPVVRAIYSSLNQLLKTMAAGDKQQFSRVVYLEYPRKGTWALAFVTGEANMYGMTAPHLNLYVPTTPNPTSGFHLIVAETEVRDSHLSVEDAFKTILSLGIAQNAPGENKR